MAYISSNANRWYCAREASYGQIPAITADNRIPAVSLSAQHQREKSQRRDKTGSRTWAGAPQGMRRHTSYSLTSYMRDWADSSVLPPQGPLFEAALGGEGNLWAAPRSTRVRMHRTSSLPRRMAWCRDRPSLRVARSVSSPP